MPRCGAVSLVPPYITRRHTAGPCSSKIELAVEIARPPFLPPLPSNSSPTRGLLVHACLLSPYLPPPSSPSLCTHTCFHCYSDLDTRWNNTLSNACKLQAWAGRAERVALGLDEGRRDPWNRNRGEESWKKIEGGRYGIRIRGAGLRGKGGGWKRLSSNARGVANKTRTPTTMGHARSTNTRL